MTDDGATSSAPMARIQGLPTELLVDERVDLKITGVTPGELVTLRARMQDETKRWWVSENSFRVDHHGTGDLSSQAPVSGSYDAADSMGFIWSMTLESDAQPPSSFMNTALAPVVVSLSVEEGGEEVATANVTRLSFAPGVVRTPVHEAGLVGTFFQPPGGQPSPAVIVVGGSGGGLSEEAAALYASHGYTALALAYFRMEHLPEELIRIPLEYFETAIQWIKKQDTVIPDRLVVSGTSRGGELVLLLGSRFPDIKAVIAYVPSSVVFGAVTRFHEGIEDPQPGWTYRGEEIPYLAQVSSPPADVIDKIHQPIPLTPQFIQALEDQERVRQATIPVEDINGPVLLISGRDDAMWPSALFSDRVMERLAERMHPYPDQHLDYEGAGHTIGPPYFPSTVTYSLHPVRRALYAYGGNAKDNAAARSDSWSHVLRFLDAHLKNASDET